MIKKLLTILGVSLLLPLTAFALIGLPPNQGGTGTTSNPVTGDLLVGTTGNTYQILHIGSTGTCLTISGGNVLWGSCGTGGGGGTGNVSTSSVPVIGSLSYWTTSGQTPEKLSSVSTTSVSCSGTLACSGFTVIGSSPITLVGSGVTSVGTNNGLTGGPITTTGTVGLDVSKLVANAGLVEWNGTQLFATGTPSLTVGYLIATSTASSTFKGALSFTYASSTATSTLAGINLPYGGCVAVGGTCLTSNTGTVTLVTGTWPIISSGGNTPNLTFGGLSTSSQAVLGSIPYFSGVNTFANEATGTVTCTGTTSCGAGSYVLGNNLTITGSGGGGSGGGTWATTTSAVPLELLNYSLNNSDIVVIGGTSTSTGKFILDPNTSRGLIPFASSTAISTTNIAAGEGGVSFPAYTFSTDPDTGVYHGGTNVVSLAAGGSGLSWNGNALTPNTTNARSLGSTANTWNNLYTHFASSTGPFTFDTADTAGWLFNGIGTTTPDDNLVIDNTANGNFTSLETANGTLKAKIGIDNTDLFNFAQKYSYVGSQSPAAGTVLTMGNFNQVYNGCGLYDDNTEDTLFDCYAPPSGGAEMTYTGSVPQTGGTIYTDWTTMNYPTAPYNTSINISKTTSAIPFNTFTINFRNQFGNASTYPYEKVAYTAFAASTTETGALASTSVIGIGDLGHPDLHGPNIIIGGPTLQIVSSSTVRTQAIGVYKGTDSSVSSNQIFGIYNNGTASTTNLTVSGISGLTQCVHANAQGIITGTGSDCGSSGSSASTTLLSDNNTFSGLNQFTNAGTTTFTGHISTPSASTTATSTLAGINLPYGGCVAVGGTCLTSNTGTVTSVDVSGGTTGLTFSGGPITSSGSITAAGTLGIANGGTNQTSFSSGGVVYYDGTRQTSLNTRLSFNGTVLTATYASSTAVSVSGPLYTNVSSGNVLVTGANGLVQGNGLVTIGNGGTFNNTYALNTPLEYNGTKITSTSSVGIFDNIISTTTASSTFAGGIDAKTICLQGTTTCLGAAGGGSGTVTNIATNNGLTGGPITNTGTIGLDLSQYPVNGLILTYNGSQITATGTPSLTVGSIYATSTTASSTISSGLSIGGKQVYATAGGLAVGNSSSAAIGAYGLGSFALGQTGASGGPIISSGQGSFAGGQSTISTGITASGNGSLAFGAGTLNNSGIGAINFGSSYTNSTNNIFEVGFTSNPALTVIGSSVGISSTTPYPNSLSVAGAGGVVANQFTATSSVASQLPYASSTAITASGQLSVASTTPTSNLIFSVGSTTPLGLTVNGQSGYLGFGTSTPEAPITFAVTSSLTRPDFIIDGQGTGQGAEMELNRSSNANTEGVIDFNTNGVNIWQLGLQNNSSDDFELWDGNDTPIYTVNKATNDTGIGTTTASAELTVWGDTTQTDTTFNVVTAASSTSLSVINNGRVGVGTTSPGSLFAINGVMNFTTATSSGSATGGFDIPNGCYAVKGTCVGGSGGGGSGTVSSGLAGQLGYYNSSGTTIVGTSTNPLYVNSLIATSTILNNVFLGKTGFGTSTPAWMIDSFSSTGAQLALSDGPGVNQWAFRVDNAGNLTISTTTVQGTATSTNPAMQLNSAGSNFGLGTSSPYAYVSVNTNPGFIGDAFNISTSSSGSLYSIDSNGHHFFSGSKPTCDANCTFLAGNDNVFYVKLGTAITSSVVTFANSWGGIWGPVCGVSDGAAVTTFVDASSTPTSVTLTPTVALTGTILAVNCQALR